MHDNFEIGNLVASYLSLDLAAVTRELRDELVLNSLGASSIAARQFDALRRPSPGDKRLRAPHHANP